MTHAAPLSTLTGRPLTQSSATSHSPLSPCFSLGKVPIIPKWVLARLTVKGLVGWLVWLTASSLVKTDFPKLAEDTLIKGSLSRTAKPQVQLIYTPSDSLPLKQPPLRSLRTEANHFFASYSVGLNVSPNCSGPTQSRGPSTRGKPVSKVSTYLRYPPRWR